MLRRLAAELATTAEEAAFVDLVGQVERRVLQLLEERKPGRRLNANVELYAGVVMSLCGIPREMFTPTFAASRVIGWCAHVLEQAEPTPSSSAPAPATSARWCADRRPTAPRSERSAPADHIGSEACTGPLDTCSVHVWPSQ